MANAVTIQGLSGATTGRGIKVAATSTPGTLIHTAVTGTTNWDLIYLWAMNDDTTARLLTIEFGGTTDPDDLEVETIQPQSGANLIIPGWQLQNALVVRAFAATANVITINGYVRRITVT